MDQKQNGNQRVSKKFKKQKLIKITVRESEIYIAIATLIEIGICSLWTIFHQIHGGVQLRYLDDYEIMEWECSQNSTVQYIAIANYMYILGLLVVLCFFSFQTRNAAKVFTESTCAYLGSFFATFTFVIVIVFYFVVTRSLYLITIQSALFLLALVIVWVLFYGIHLYKWFANEEERNAKVITAEPSRTATGSPKDGLPAGSGSSCPRSEMMKDPSSPTPKAQWEAGKERHHDLHRDDSHRSNDSRDITCTLSNTNDQSNNIGMGSVAGAKAAAPRVTAFNPITLGTNAVLNPVQDDVEMAEYTIPSNPVLDSAITSEDHSLRKQGSYGQTSEASGLDEEEMNEIADATMDVSMTDSVVK